MRKDKASLSVVGGIVLVVSLILLAIAVPWTLSLADTTTGTGTSTQFKGVMENAQHAYIAERMELFVVVEVYSFYANLQWGNDDGTCYVEASLQNSNGVYDSPIVQFATVPYTGVDRGEFGRINYFGTTLSGEYESIPPGDYWLVLHVSCTVANQYIYWRWYHAGGSDFDPAVVSPNGPCLDNDFDHFWEDGECSSGDSSYVLEGRVPSDDDGPPVIPPVTPTEPTDDVPDIVTTGVKAEDYSWLLILIAGGVIAIVIIAAVVMLRT